jgi:hypothetical protein
MAYYADYSARHMSAQELINAGYTGVIRYIDEPGRLGTKHINRAEWDDFNAHGLDIRLVFEVNQNDPLGGYSQGRAYATRALAGADYFGYTDEIYFCADRWFNASGYTLITVPTWQAYLDGAASFMGYDRTGAYGFRDAMDAGVGHAAWLWQCGSKTVLHPNAHIWQDNNVQPVVGGTQTDRNLILKTLRGGDVALDVNDKNFIIDCLGHSAGGRTGTSGENNLNGWWYNDRFEGTKNFAQVFFDQRDKVNALTTNLNQLGTNLTAALNAIGASLGEIKASIATLEAKVEALEASGGVDLTDATLSGTVHFTPTPQS